MSNTVLDNSNISVHLGKSSVYKSTYDKSLLVREPRQNNRTYLNIDGSNLPFVGFDTWNAYECSFLLNNGCPVTGVAKLSYPCSSEYIVESKSLKLYLNSFNMQHMGSNMREAIDAFTKTASSDLSSILGAGVKVGFIPSVVYNEACASANTYYALAPSPFHTNDIYVNLEESIEPQVLAQTTFDKYQESPELLSDKVYYVLAHPNQSKQYFYSSLLKSNCRVTSQPDWGDVFIYIDCDKVINTVALLKYIVSFRGECHFHEEICECIYTRLWDFFNPRELFIMCLYARRGGIDINPVRASNVDLLYRLSANLADVLSPHIKTAKQ